MLDAAVAPAPRAYAQTVLYDEALWIFGGLGADERVLHSRQRPSRAAMAMW